MTKDEIRALTNKELYELFKDLIYDSRLTYKEQMLLGQVRKEMERRLEDWLTD